ncbi:signal peptidase II [Actinokineospora enzanensis]|uniref:signal peptidase II n=1 Tax=Actinokineospora enzanensis TaxID=155975 RepID=UPI0003691CD9|nr:signal peptidase II [Actinokineospora enzanensis]
MNTERGDDSVEQETASADQVTEQPQAPRQAVLMILAAVLVYILDLVTKVIIVSTMAGHEPIKLLGGLFYLQLIRNSGAAYSMGSGMTWVFTIIAAAVVVAMVWILPRLRSVGWAIGLGFVLAGALGNLTDRVFRAPGGFQGHVVDFISAFAPNAEKFPVFNFADAGITIGAVFIIVTALLGRDYNGTSTRKAKKVAE